MNRKVLALLCLCVVGVLCACSKDNLDGRFKEEEDKLAEYITTTFGDAAISLGGGAWLVKTVKYPESATVEAGNYILWNLKITNQVTGETEYTSDKSADKFVDSYVDGGPELTVVLSSFPIDEGLKKMSKGEKGDVYIPSRWIAPDFQTRIYSVEIVDVIRKFSEYQENLMSGYIKKTCKGASADTIKNVVSTIDKTEYNVMYYITDKGSGDPVKENLNVETKTSIFYSIQENIIRPYSVEQDKDKVWSTKSGEKINTLTKTNCVGEILKKMNKGGTVVVAMPSKLYWEDKNLPKNNEGQFYIPKWSVVIFIITINK